MHLTRMTRTPLSILACAIVLAGCATARMSSEWKDSSFTAALPEGSRVVVSCPTRDDTVRRVCEDQWAVLVGAEGITALRAYALAGLPPDGERSADQIRAAARSAGAGAVISMQLSESGVAVIDSGPQVGIGVGGGSGGHRGGGISFGGVGVSFPIGGASTSTSRGMASSTSLTDVASGATVWSGSAVTGAGDDLTAQVSALTRITADALKKAGLL